MKKLPAIVVLLGAIGVSAPAFAKTPHAPRSTTVGAGYVVGRTATSRTTLTREQVDAVVASKRADLDACLAHVPANPHKKDADIVLSLEIDDTGEVQTSTVTNVPEDVERCIAVVAAGWEFPSCDVEADASTFTYQLRGARPTVAARDAAPAKPGPKPPAH